MICKKCNVLNTDDRALCIECNSELKMLLIKPFEAVNNKKITKPNKTPVVIEWEGLLIEFYAYLSPKYLWLATENQLWIDDKFVAKSGGLNFGSEAKCKLLHDRKILDICFKTKTRFKSGSGLDYFLIVDNTVVKNGIINLSL